MHYLHHIHRVMSYYRMNFALITMFYCKLGFIQLKQTTIMQYLRIIYRIMRYLCIKRQITGMNNALFTPYIMNHVLLLRIIYRFMRYSCIKGLNNGMNNALFTPYLTNHVLLLHYLRLIPL
jgi:hypothetical protein